jgi:hypothetical protein
MEKKDRRDRGPIPAQLGYHGFEHDPERKPGAGLEKKEKKTGGQYIPTIENTRRCGVFL